MAQRFTTFLGICFILLMAVSQADAAKLMGTITNDKDEPLPFANIYIQGTSNGTTSNEIGHYELELSPGTYKVVYHYIGYKKTYADIIMADQHIVRDVKLSQENFQINEIVISGAEDPAYAIMRKAIAKRDEYYDKVKSFHSSAYVKGLQRIYSAPDKIFGQTVNFDGTLDSNNAGIVYLSESIADLYYEKPDKVKETVTSSKVSGNSQTFTWNRAGDFLKLDFYKSNFRIDGLSDRIYITPMANNAFTFYKYRLEGYYLEDGRRINKIAVIPKRKTDPVFAGHIYIVEDEWSMSGVDLILTKENQVNFIDTIWANYTYVPLVEQEDTVWLPLSQRFDFNFSIFGINAGGYFVAVYQDYEVNPDLERKLFNNEVLKVDEEANKKDTTYWKKSRPIPLTNVEEADYTLKDAIEKKRESKSYLDSLDKKRNKFSILSIFLGYRFQNTFREFRVRFNPLIDIVHFNTVEGVNLTIKPEMWKDFEKRRVLRIQPTARYGFSNKHFNASVNTTYYYKRAKFSLVSLYIGQYVYQFNRGEAINELINTAYTVLGERNYMKIYEERYARLSHRFEIVNGLMLWTSASYGRRMPLANSNMGTLVDKDHVEYTSNVPDNDLVPDTPFEEHEAFILTATLRYRPGQKYMTRPYRKIVLGSKWPEFRITYKKAIPDVLGSDVNFDQIELALEHNFHMGLLGNAQIKGIIGTFINDARVEFMDFKHFNGNRTIFGLNYNNGFQLLRYYRASTTNEYAVVHFEHNLDGFLFNKIPFIRKLKFQAFYGAHFLITKEFPAYAEFNVGIENILRIMRLDFVFGVGGETKGDFGVRIGINFGQL